MSEISYIGINSLLFKLAILSEDYEASLNNFLKLSYEDEPQQASEAQFYLGLMYKYINEIKDENKSKRFFIRSFYTNLFLAKKGICKSQYYICLMLFEGFGIEKNIGQAFEWCKKSADQNYEDAQFMLANMYLEGLGIEKDYSKAIEYYNKSAEQGNDLAQYKLGEIYEQGIGVEKDNKKSFEWYKKSAEQDNFRAQCRLGDIFYKEYNDFDIKQDINKAIEWFNKSVEQDYEKAKKEFGLLYLNLGDIYYSKYEELSKDCEKSEEYYEKLEEYYKKSEEYYNKSAEYNNRAKVKLRDNFEGYDIYIGSDEEKIDW